MGPPDGPSRPNQSEWAQMIQTELNSWDPSCLSSSFHPRARQRGAAAVWRPIPLALAMLIVALLAATALAGGPRALTIAIGNLAGGRPQPTATPAPAVRPACSHRPRYPEPPPPPRPLRS
jgi:hypothetical protein